MRYSENKEIGAYSVEVKYIKVVLLSQSEKKKNVLFGDKKPRNMSGIYHHGCQLSLRFRFDSLKR